MYKLHVFVCTSSPETHEKCGNKGSQQLLNSLRRKCNQKSWGPDVRINISGCLGYCQRGIVAVIYPQGKWFFNLKEDQEEVILKELESLIEGAP